MNWATAFIWTCAIETPIYVVLLRRSFPAWWAPVVLSLGLQAVTHPPLWLLFPRRGSFWAPFIAFELGIALVEGALVALLLWRRGGRRPLSRGMLAGFLANAVSATIGLLL